MSYPFAAATFLFEVMDKEPSLFRVAIECFGLGTLAFILLRKRSWWGLLPTILLLVLSVAHLQELWDPHVGAAIFREAGAGYFRWSYVFIASGVILPIIGLLTRSRGERLTADS